MVQIIPETNDLTKPDNVVSQEPQEAQTPEPQTISKAEAIQKAPHLMFGSVIDRATTQVDALPSKFLPYPKGAKVYYRPYTYKDLDDFNDSSLDMAQRLMFILNGVKTVGMEPLDLTLGDFLFIALYRRISSLGTHTFQIKITRDNGAFKTSKAFSFDDIQFDEIKAPALPIVANIGGNELHFMPLTIGRFIEVLQKDILPGSKDYERAIMAAQVINIDYDSAYSIINNAFGQDLVVLNQVDQFLLHTVMPLDVSYVYNGEVVKERVPLDNPLTLIYPFCRPEDTTGNPIRFGL